MMLRLRLNTYVAPILFLLFLVSSSVVQSSRPLTTEQEQNRELEEVSAREENIVLELEVESFKLMGMENCNIGDEECLQRRMTLEAHLDYIYTQHHKP